MQGWLPGLAAISAAKPFVTQAPSIQLVCKTFVPGGELNAILPNSLRAVCLCGMATFFLGLAAAQAPAPAKAASGATAVVPKAEGTLAQVMRGILFPNSNVVFFAQGKDPAAVKPADNPSASTDRLSDTYGGWVAVENSSIAISEAANLLTIPGRLCSNGKPVPIKNADWPKFVEGLRVAGMTAYKAAQSKSEAKMLDAADVVTTACMNCHVKYRDVPGALRRGVCSFAIG